MEYGGDSMKAEQIKNLVGDTEGLFSGTALLIERTAKALENDMFNEEEGKLVIDTLFQTLGENGDKMQKYLINSLSAKLTKTTLATEKIEWLNEKLMEEASC